MPEHSDWNADDVRTSHLHGLEGTMTHQELEHLLHDYSMSDILDLFILYDELGAEEVDSDFHNSINELNQLVA